MIPKNKQKNKRYVKSIILVDSYNAKIVYGTNICNIVSDAEKFTELASTNLILNIEGINE